MVSEEETQTSFSTWSILQKGFVLSPISFQLIGVSLSCTRRQNRLSCVSWQYGGGPMRREVSQNSELGEKSDIYLINYYYIYIFFLQLLISDISSFIHSPKLSQFNVKGHNKCNWCIKDWTGKMSKLYMKSYSTWFDGSNLTKKSFSGERTSWSGSHRGKVAWRGETGEVWDMFSPVLCCFITMKHRLHDYE